MRYLKDYRFLVFLFLPFFKPGCINDLWSGSGIDVFWDLYKILSIVMIWIIWLSIYHKASPLVIAYSIYSIFTIIAVMHTDISRLYGTLLRELSIVSMLLVIEMSMKASGGAVIRALYSIICVWIMIQIVLLVPFPNGFNHGTNETRVHFLGKDNEYSLFMALGFLICMLYRNRVKKSIFAIFMVLLALGIGIYFASGSGLIVVLVCAAYVIIRKMNLKLLNISVAIYAGLALNIGFVFLNAMDFFSGIITNLLHKDITLTGRTVIWKSALAHITLNPIWGTGQSSVIVPGWTISYYAHNALLDIGMRYGVIAIVLFTGILVLVAIKCRKDPLSINHSYNALAVFVTLLTGIVEGLEYRNELFIMLALVYYSSYFQPMLEANRPNASIAS